MGGNRASVTAMRVAVAVVLFTFACSSKKSDEPAAGSSTPPPTPVVDAAAKPTGSDGSGSAAAGSGSGSAGGDFDFKKLTHEQQLDFMKKTVVPTMKPIFVAFDNKKYGETGSAPFGCKTCHGKDPRGTKYKMPSTDLPKLDFAAIEAGKQKPEVAKWMSEKVKPEMAKLFHRPEMTEKNPTGFGCLACHQQKK